MNLKSYTSISMIMFTKPQTVTSITILASISIILIIGSFHSYIFISKNYPNYFLRISSTVDALQRAKYLEEEHERQYQVTAVTLFWKRRAAIRKAVENYIKSNCFKEIIVWNNNPKVNLTLMDVSTTNESSSMIRIINSEQNLKDEAKYRACAEAKTLVCFYADDDWDASRYLKALIASFRSDPNVLHTTTNAVTYYNNLLWTFMDSRIGLHTGSFWIGCGSVYLREYAQRHLQLLEENLKDHRKSLPFSDVVFSMWLNDIPSQMVVDLSSLPLDFNATDIPFSITEGFDNFHINTSIIGIRALYAALSSNSSKTNVKLSRQPKRRFPYTTRSPSRKDDFIFYSNVLPIDIERVPFDIKLEPDRATYRNVPHGLNYTHFANHHTLHVVDNNIGTCWEPNRGVKKGDFFAIDFLRIQSGLIFSLTTGHSQIVQRSLNIRISFDGDGWLSDPSFKSIFNNANQTFSANRTQFIIDSRYFPSQLQSFRYIVFNATYDIQEPFQVCDVQIVNGSSIKLQ